MSILPATPSNDVTYPQRCRQDVPKSIFEATAPLESGCVESNNSCLGNGAVLILRSWESDS
jgi:hypothetical protein